LSQSAKVTELLGSLKKELREGATPQSVEGLRERLDPLSIGLIHQCPTLGAGARMFRIRAMAEKPKSLDNVGQPPPELSSIGRLNEKGESVLYLGDSPETAFAERGKLGGVFILSEWRVTAEKLALANGAIPPAILAQRFPKQEFEKDPNFLPKPEAEKIQDFFRDIYTLDAGNNSLLYRWSIACASVNGFAHKCDRVEGGQTPDGLTRWQGRCPFGGIVYPSVRTNQKSLNFALNDHGRSYVKLDHVQWVRRDENGSYISLDFANDWDGKKIIHWQNRPANFQLKAGEKAKVTKIAETVWRYDTEDGSIPWFV